MNKIVRGPPSRPRAWASAIAARRSATPLDTADSCTKTDRVARATIRASVVLPTPGGPQKIADGTASRSIARRSGRPSPISASWPANSASERGRMRAASGARGVDRVERRRRVEQAGAAQRGPRSASAWHGRSIVGWGVAARRGGRARVASRLPTS